MWEKAFASPHETKRTPCSKAVERACLEVYLHDTLPIEAPPLKAIVVQQLSKCYSHQERPVQRLLQLLSNSQREADTRGFCALERVDFALEQGEALGIVGKNGAGKSTLLQLISGTLAPTSGTISVHGRVAALLELGAGFHPEFTGRENIFMNASILGMPEEEIQEHFDAIVDFSGIRDFIDDPVKTYSSGMQVRLAFSIATTIEPDILVIDEALSVGDGEFARKSFERIMALRERGTTLLFCSHAMYHVESLCERALWLERGAVRMLDAAHRVTRAYQESLLQEHSAGTNRPSPQETGHHLARLTRVAISVNGVAGQRFNLHPGDAHIRMEIDYFADPTLPTPSVAFGLETAAGLPVSSGSTYHDNIPMERNAEGKGRVVLEIFDPPLMRGEYRLTVFLACEQALHVYDQALHCAEFVVTDSGTEQGITFLPRSWNGGNTIIVPERQCP